MSAMTGNMRPPSATPIFAPNDGERMDWLARNLYCADFRYDGIDATVLVIRFPRDVAVGANLRANVDAAMAWEGRTA